MSADGMRPSTRPGWSTADECDGHGIGAHAVERATQRAAWGVMRQDASRGGSMTVAEDLLRRHIETLVADNARWQTMLAGDVVWELPFAPAIGHPARVSGRVEVVQFAEPSRTSAFST